jgi:hypothetical protein
VELCSRFAFVVFLFIAAGKAQGEPLDKPSKLEQSSVGTYITDQGDTECYGDPQAKKPCDCDLHKDGLKEASSSGNAISQSLVGNPAAQAKYEQDFFWDFLKDQKTETTCNVDMLKALDPLPTQVGCSDGSDSVPVHKSLDPSTKMVAKPEAIVNQAAILQQIWDVLGPMAKADKACTAATKTYNGTKFATQNTSRAYGEVWVNGEAESKLPDQLKAMNDACEPLANTLDGLWSGKDPTMRAFINHWIKEYQTNPALAADKTGLAFFHPSTQESKVTDKLLREEI